jgi:hypothetical protein
MPRDSYLLPLSLKFPRVCPCECIHEDPLFPIPPAEFNSSMDGAPVDAWLHFPGLKVGQNVSPHSYYLTIGRRCSPEYGYS